VIIAKKVHAPLKEKLDICRVVLIDSPKNAEACLDDFKMAQTLAKKILETDGDPFKIGPHVVPLATSLLKASNNCN
jgi:hypothetical protein